MHVELSHSRAMQDFLIWSGSDQHVSLRPWSETQFIFPMFHVILQLATFYKKKKRETFGLVNRVSRGEQPSL